jgi:hypothetical protein
MISIQLEGGKELERKLKALETKVAKKVVRKAVRNALKPALAATKTNARSMVGGHMGGLIASNIVLRARKKQRRGSYAMDVRLKSESEGAPAEFIHTTKKGERQNIPAAIEFGHGPGKEQVAIPFARSAADSTKAETLRIVTAEIKKGIEQIFKAG